MDKITKKLLKNFPILSMNIENNTIVKYSAAGAEELNSENKEAIAVIEEKNKKHRLKVICVLSDKLFFDKNTVVDVDEYIFISKGCKPEIIDDNLLIYTESHNKTWGISDMGLIEITEKDGIIKRTCE